MTQTEQHLAQADRHIVESEIRITRQGELIARLLPGSEHRERAKELLATMEQALIVLHAHRQLILAEMEGLP
jgi:antitoxin (DNA-binding transcriptional repressor) of toxin-antitoxin stability system